jgi:hypothetical protein
MPLPIYSQYPNDPKYRQAEALYDEAISIAYTDRATALEKLRRAEQLLQSCNEEGGRGVVRDKIRELGG